MDQFWIKRPSKACSILSFVLISFILSGCIQSIKMNKEQIAGLHRVGVVSIVQNKIIVKHIGTTVLTNSEKEFDGPWQFNDLIIETIKKDLSEYSYAVVDLTYDQKSLEKTYEDKIILTATYRTYDHAPIKEELKKIARDNALDGIILVTSSFQDDYIEKTNQTLHKQGLYKRSFLGHENAYLYFWGMVKVLDGRSMDLLALRPVGFYSKIDPALWKEDIGLISSDDLRTFEATLKNGIKNAMKYNLSRIGLINCIPDDYYCDAPISGEK